MVLLIYFKASHGVGVGWEGKAPLGNTKGNICTSICTIEELLLLRGDEKNDMLRYNSSINSLYHGT